MWASPQASGRRAPLHHPAHLSSGEWGVLPSRPTAFFRVPHPFAHRNECPDRILPGHRSPGQVPCLRWKAASWGSPSSPGLFQQPCSGKGLLESSLKIRSSGGRRRADRRHQGPGCDHSPVLEAQVAESACHAGHPGLIPGWGRSPGGENGNPLQYSCLENPMDGGAW